MGEITRFAPSPTGRLHLGHALAALVARVRAGEGGHFLLRIEDLDEGRSRPEYVSAIEEDLRWLGLDWARPVWRQSAREQAYGSALERLRQLGLIYPCFCTRSAIAAEVARSAQAPHGPEGLLYPGTCRTMSSSERQDRLLSGQSHALRLDMQAALSLVGRQLRWEDRRAGVQIACPEWFGDVVLARKDALASYHLAVVVDDAAQGVSLVTRGEDLLAATHVHRLLQELLGLPVPHYEHHRLVCDGQGRRLAKRDSARSLEQLRSEGWSAQRVWAALAPI